MVSSSGQGAARKVLNFWFGPSPSRYGPPNNALWFGSDAALDLEIRAKFGADVESALAGDATDLRASGVKGDLAHVILLDQFTRNVFRSDKRAFSGDKIALAIADRYFDQGDLHATAKNELTVWQRHFLYMPFMHDETIEGQLKSRDAIEELRLECKTAAAEGNSDAASTAGAFNYAVSFGMSPTS